MTSSRALRLLLVSASLLTLVVACSNSSPETPRQAEQRLGEAGPPGPNALSVTGNLDLAVNVNQEVTLPGRVQDVVGPGVFHLGGDVIGSTPVLVVGPPGGAIAKDAPVQVTGEVVPTDELDSRGVPDGVDVGALDAQPDDYVVLATEVRSSADVEAEASAGGG